MNSKRIEPHLLATAAAQGVAIALAARDLPGEFDLSEPIIAGRFPSELFEVTLAQVDGQFAVKNVQPFNAR
ncbi:hypothetical protein ACFVHB_28790 [Kitasatospora sp. NPDC127111]|uniref:hypothetical protein n=1 Tax=Kitasatospora sp. NPDC127111 TaxID=3345363 RepID=UPI00362C1BDA